MAEFFGEVGREDGPQLLAVRIAQGHVVEQPAGHGREGRDVGGQGLDRVPVLVQLGAGAVGKFQAVDQLDDLECCDDHQVGGGIVEFSGALKARGEDAGRRTAGQGAQVTGPGGGRSDSPPFQSLLSLGVPAVDPAGQLLAETGLATGRITHQPGGQFTRGALAQRTGPVVRMARCPTPSSS